MTKCPRCVLKHLTTAVGLLWEAEDYIDHGWLAVGQLVLAERESGDSMREVRLAVEQSLLDGEPCAHMVESLIPKYRQIAESPDGGAESDKNCHSSSSE